MARRTRRPSTAGQAGDSADTFLREAVAISEPTGSGALPAAPLEAGQIVGERFCIERLAGSGGMGAVYLARDLAGTGYAAVKVLARQTASIRARLVREATVLASIEHPGVVRYVAHGTTAQGLPFLAMDWLDGEDLARRLARSPLSPDDGLVAVRRASEGLALAHARGVVHRDIKPSNLFLVSGSPASTKVIDFGVARVEAGAAGLTRPGTSIGTAGYMAPEQAAGVADVDARADVYALGCVLFECLTGRPPFVGRPSALLVKVLREKAPRPSALRPALSDAVDSLMNRLLAKDWEERPRDASELLVAIDRLRGAVLR